LVPTWTCAISSRKSKERAMLPRSLNPVARAASGQPCAKKVLRSSAGLSGRWRKLPNKPWLMRGSSQETWQHLSHTRPTCALLMSLPNNSNSQNTWPSVAISQMLETHLLPPFQWQCTVYWKNDQNYLVVWPYKLVLVPGWSTAPRLYDFHKSTTCTDHEIVQTCATATLRAY